MEDSAGAFCVFYSGSPFSDFAPYTFTIEGTVYASVEHYVQIQMLRSFGLFKLAMKLSTIFDANHFRRSLRQNLRSLTQNGLFDERMFNSWRSTNAMRLLKKANRAKFEQNFDLKKHLLETGDRILVFTSKHDRLFGVGMDETSFLDWVRQQHWKIDDLLDSFTTDDSLVDGVLGRNLLGFCLVDIRAEISGQPSVLAVWKQRTRERKDRIIDVVIDLEDEETAAVQPEDAADGDATESLRDPPEETDTHLTDDHILANLSNAEASVARERNPEENEIRHQSDQHATSSVVIFRVPNEKRFVFRRSDYVRRVIGDTSEGKAAQPPDSASSSAAQQPSTSAATPTFTNQEANCQTEVSSLPVSDKRTAALERLKALRFEKPMINPFAVTMGSVPNLDASGQNAKAVPRNSTSQPVHSAKWKEIPRLCDIPSIQPPLYGTRCAIVYPQLEPGEVPSPEYGPTIVSTVYQPSFGVQQLDGAPPDSSCNGDVPAMSSGCNFAPDLSSGPPPTSVIEPGELWTPSSNPMKEIFESAKVGIKNLIENAKQGHANADDISRLLLLRPPPIQSQPHARKRKCTSSKKAPSYAGVVFNSKDAQMRHLSNRWVKGGRLTTTGEFEECGSDEEDAADVARTLRQLEAAPASSDTENERQSTRSVQFHVVYEDTNEYADYVKWYADVHGCSPWNVVDDEYQQYLRQWYRWYRTAVKFVDVEPLSDDGEDDDERSVWAEDATEQEKSQLLMQQWRWQQINEWELKARAQSSTAPAVAQETYCDDVSVSGKPLTYSSLAK